VAHTARELGGFWLVRLDGDGERALPHKSCGQGGAQGDLGLHGIGIDGETRHFHLEGLIAGEQLYELLADGVQLELLLAVGDR